MTLYDSACGGSCQKRFGMRELSREADFRGRSLNTVFIER